MVLGRGPHHGRAAHVDELDRRVRGEGVEVAHHQVDEADAQALQGVEVVGLGPVGQDAAVDDRVEGLDPAAQHLGGAGQLGHLDVVDAGLGQGRRGAAARDQLPAQVGQAPGEVLDPGLVVDGQQCPHSVVSSGAWCRASAPPAARPGRQVVDEGADGGRVERALHRLDALVQGGLGVVRAGPPPRPGPGSARCPSPGGRRGRWCPSRPPRRPGRRARRATPGRPGSSAGWVFRIRSGEGVVDRLGQHGAEAGHDHHVDAAATRASATAAV